MRGAPETIQSKYIRVPERESVISKWNEDEIKMSI
jgi:hypothetical protein